MSPRRIYWWHCDRCGDRMAQRATLAESEFDRDEHIKRCQPHARRAPWERNISTSTILIFDA